jgi:hypothetical protein
MANEAKGNVAAPGFPGDVLEPNNAEQFEQAVNKDDSSMFGTEMPKPGITQPKNTVQFDANGVPTDPTLRGRYEFHQSRADKAENEVRQLREQLKAIEPILPLVNVIQKDAELQNTVRTHLTGKKPVEAPQRPEGYSEVEAYSNPESTSFKYRVANERYKDERLNQLQEQIQQTNAQREQELQDARRAQSNYQAQQKFQSEVMQMGIAPEQFPEFMNLVQNATPKEMVEFFQWKNGQSGKPRFDVPGNGFSPRPSASPSYGNGPVDISSEILEASKILR